MPENLPKTGIVGYWPFNGNADDESGASNHGTVQGATLTADRYVADSSAFHFDGNGETIQLPSATFIPFHSDFTISFWFRSEFNSRMEPLNLTDSGKFVSNLNFAFNNEAACWVYWNSGGFNNIKTGQEGDFMDGHWHNLMLLRSDSIVKLYFDGVLAGIHENYTPPIGNDAGITIGSTAHPWHGELDDLLIYDRALTDSEILQVSDQPKITFTSPRATDAFPVGYISTLQWLKPISVSTVKIEYSINDGTSWHLIADVIDSASLSFNWEIPALPGHKCILRITDINNENNVAISDTFLISNYKWELSSHHGPFSVRDGAGAYAFNEKMFLVGGWNPLDPENYPLVTNSEVWETADGSNWSLAAVAPWEPRHTYGNLVHDNKMWILGGDQLQCSFQTDIWNSENGSTWNLVNETAPWGERMLHLYYSFDGKLWVMGGQKIAYCTNPEEVAYNDVWNSTDGVTWNLVTDSAAWSPRGMISGSTVFQNKMWILGGGIYQNKYYNDVWNSEDGLNWNLVTKNAPWTSRQYQAVAVYDSAMWILGGVHEADKNDVWFTRDGVRWYNLHGTPWPARHAASVFNYDSSLWIAAGYLHNDVWRLNIQPCPSITIQPQSQDVIAGSPVKLFLQYPPPSATYQWQIQTEGGWQNLADTLNFVGTSSDTLTILHADAATVGPFRCVVSEGSCSDISEPATINICPDFTRQPDDVVIQEHGSGFIIAQYPDSTAIYQWQIYADGEWVDLGDNAEFAGTTTDSLEFLNADFSRNNSQIRCRVATNTCSVSSHNTTLTICPELDKQPTDKTVIPGADVIFSVIYPGSPAGYQWQIASEGNWIDIQDGNGYSGARSDQLNVAGANETHNGQTFRCFVTSGPCSIVSNEVKMFVCGPTDIVSPPNQIARPGDTVVFPIVHENANLTFQWQLKTGFVWMNLADSGQFKGTLSDSLMIMKLTLDNHLQEYRFLVSDTACTASGSIVSLEVCPFIAKQSGSQNTLDGQKLIFWVSYPFEDAHFQWQTKTSDGWIDLSDDGKFTGTTTDSLIVKAPSLIDTGSEFRCVISSGSCLETSLPMEMTVCPVIELQPQNQYVLVPAAAEFRVQTGAGAAYQWQLLKDNAWTDISQTDPTFVGSATSTLSVVKTLTVHNEQLFRCVITAGNCSVVSDPAALFFCTPIQIQPESQFASPGDSVILTVQHPSIAATYQWQYDRGFGWDNVETHSLGSDTDSLVLLAVSSTDHGMNYRVVITDGSCMITSDIVTLFVHDDLSTMICPTVDTQPIEGHALTGEDVNFSIRYSRISATFQWQITLDSTWVDLVEGDRYSGTQTQELYVKSVAYGDDGQLFRCQISDGACLVTSDAVALRIMTITENIETKTFKVYPNPTYNYLTIATGGNGYLPSYEIFDQIGKIHKSGILTDEVTQIDISGFSPGIYLLKLEGVPKTIKIVKQ